MKRGQSLVEMAVIAPLLIFIFIGVVEVGWAMLGYMQLSQIVREVTRFSVRQDITKLWRNDEVEAKRLVLLHFQEIGGNPNTTLTIHRYRVFTGKPCTTVVCSPNCQPGEFGD